MKKLKDCVSLKGQMDTITVDEFRRNPGDVFAQVAMGKIFVISRYGKAVAVLSQPPGEALDIEIGPTGLPTYRRGYEYIVETTPPAHRKLQGRMPK